MSGILQICVNPSCAAKTCRNLRQYLLRRKVLYYQVPDRRILASSTRRNFGDRPENL